MVSAVILTRNEEKNIIDCIDSVRWCDEILVIDDESDDNTVALAKQANVTVIQHPLKNFSVQRNFALEQAKGDWVLFVDADERVSKAFQREIQETIQHNDKKGYYLKRQDILWGKELRYGETGNTRLLRLAKKGTGVWTGDVHEVWRIKGSTGELINPLIHYPHQTIAEFLSEINRYSDIRAQELFQKKVPASLLNIIGYPKAKFIYNYFIRLGILDGIPGFIVAMMMSYHSFLVRGKLWLLYNK